VLIVSTARPGLYERRPYWFEGRDFHRQLELKPLSKRINRQLVAEVLQKIPDLSKTLSELIVNNAEGNPFYVEELVKVLVEAGVILTREPEWFVDEEKLEKTDVPSTLTGVLQARLERLPKAERTLIQQASVVGRVFWDQVVSYLNHQGEGELEETSIQEGLVNLRGREMIYRRELSTFLEATEYIFKHAVLREVTYESVLKKLRRDYHALAAEWLMEQRGDRTGEVIGLIADHLERAGEREEALQYLKLAGEQAAEKYANKEAVDYFSRALALVSDNDLETRFDLLLSQEEVLAFQSELEAQRQNLEALERLAEIIESLEKKLELGVRWSNYLFAIGDYYRAADIAEHVVADAEAARTKKFVANGQLCWGRALIWQGQYKIVRPHLEQALAGFQAIDDQRMEGITFLALGAMSAGLFDLEGWQFYAQQALSIARLVENRSAEAEAINHLGFVADNFGNYLIAEEYYKEYLLLAREIGSRQKEQFALEALGSVAKNKNDYLSALDFTKQSLDISEAIGNEERHGMVLILLGIVYTDLEEWDKATKSYQQAMELFEGTGLEWGIARSRNGLARVALAQGDVDLAMDTIEEILTYLERGKNLGYGQGLTESYLVCVQVLVVARDPRAREVLEKGYAELQERAAKIKDPKLQKSFLENVPWNHEIVRLWEEKRYQRINP
jgi:predicted ATPase